LLFILPFDHASSPAPGMHFIQALLFHKQALRFLKGIVNLLWVASELSNPQSLTHAALARGPFWLYAFGPAVLHG